MEEKPSKYEFINAEGSSVSKAASRRAARAHVMRRYHNEKRTHIGHGKLHEPFQGPSHQRPTPKQPMMFQWHAPISSSQAASTPPHSQSPVHLSLTDVDDSVRLSESVEQCYRCFRDFVSGRQLSSMSQMQPHPRPGLEPSFPSSFPVDRRSLSLLQFSEFSNIPYSALLSVTHHLLSPQPSQKKASQILTTLSRYP